MGEIFFYVLAFGSMMCAIGALWVFDVVYAILFLVGLFFHVAVLFVILNAEFLAFATIMVSVGAVSLLFLFVVMTIPSHKSKAPVFFVFKKPALYGGIFLFLELALILGGSFQGTFLIFDQNLLPAQRLHALGRALYTDYAFLLQMLGLILLVATIVAVVLVARRGRFAKNQKLADQWQVTAKSRLSLKNVKSGEGIS